MKTTAGKLVPTSHTPLTPASLRQLRAWCSEWEDRAPEYMPLRMGQYLINKYATTDNIPDPLLFYADEHEAGMILMNRLMDKLSKV